VIKIPEDRVRDYSNVICDMIEDMAFMPYVQNDGELEFKVEFDDFYHWYIRRQSTYNIEFNDGWQDLFTDTVYEGSAVSSASLDDLILMICYKSHDKDRNGKANS